MAMLLSRQKIMVAHIRVLMMEMESNKCIPDIFRRQDLNLKMREECNWMSHAVD